MDTMLVSLAQQSPALAVAVVGISLLLKRLDRIASSNDIISFRLGLLLGAKDMDRRGKLPEEGT